MTEFSRLEDEYLFGWDEMPGIVSVWANREGRAVIWRRVDGRVVGKKEHFRPWLLATSLDDLTHLGAELIPYRSPGWETASICYRGLDGPDGSYRFLVMSPDGRILERTIFYGASRRLKRRISSLNELQNEYYRVGPTEQYLMQTGRVYFRGMNYEDLHRFQFDLETTDLDPRKGRIFLVAIRDSRGFVKTLEAPAPDDEKRLIADLCALIRERDPDIIENHNLFGFDFPFLEHRALVHNVPLELGRVGGPPFPERREETLAVGPEVRQRFRYSIAGRELIDTLDAVRRHDFAVRDMPSHSLKDVARYFGIASADRVYIEGSAIYDTYRSEPERVRRYALDDVAEVDGLSQRLLGAPFALASMAPRRYERLVLAGPAMGILEPMLVRAYLRSGAALPCQTIHESSSNEMFEGAAVHLFASGVAEHVVKTDVASLYPSLMRTFQIGPACDRLGVLLKILDRLTDLRLDHKRAAREALAGSAEANHYEATQLAMKILINAACGYMAAGSMALFADAHAAGDVMRRGREMLSLILEELSKRGMAPVEADTDGVYFAVPTDWTEEQERALVAEIGTLLPAGIRLEYEGRYQAMLSHEVKNYALLTYDGRLIVHGVALRSSRSEPFGERFLRKALLCTMRGDVAGVRAIFLETVDALRNRTLPASDVCTRVRLSKTPEAYLASRSSRPEPQYEVLLTVGRNHWSPGERVRFYRTRNKTYVWLPEENEEVPVETEWATGEYKQEPARVSQQPAVKQRIRVTQAAHEAIANRRDYDVNHYLQVLVSSYAARLRKAFAPGDFDQLFRLDDQLSLFEQPIDQIQPLWIRCS